MGTLALKIEYLKIVFYDYSISVNDIKLGFLYIWTHLSMQFRLICFEDILSKLMQNGYALTLNLLFFNCYFLQSKKKIIMLKFCG